MMDDRFELVKTHMVDWCKINGVEIKLSAEDWWNLMICFSDFYAVHGECATRSECNKYK